MRNYKRKTSRGTDKSVMLQAVEIIISKKAPVKRVAREFKIPPRTLDRYYKKYVNNADSERKTQNVQIEHVGYKKSRQIFSDEQEQVLVNYIEKASDIYYGLAPQEVRKLAYQYAKLANVQMPQIWSEKSSAGVDWFTAFLKRNPRLSIRAPEATSLSRATSFNPTNVAKFFENLQTVYNRHKFEAADMWNLDECGVTTVQKPIHVVARKGSKQVGRITSGERGILVTVVAAISASGNTIPPFFVFPRVNYKDHFIRDAPTGSAGAANASGWMLDVHFVEFSHHFVKFVRPSKERPVLLVLDNHESHLSIEALDYFKTNGVCVLSFPPHCNHRLQPLDRTVFGPFKKFYNSFADSWMTNNPGKTMTIYDIPGIVASAWPLALTPKNNASGFRVTGIWPFNPHVFTEDDFLPTFSTDRPDPENRQEPSRDLNESELVAAEVLEDVSGLNDAPRPSNVAKSENENPQNMSLEELRPFPKAGPRKTTQRGRKQRKTCILTDSPVRAALQAEKENRKPPQGAKRDRKRSKPLEEQPEENPQSRKRGRPKKVPI